MFSLYILLYNFNRKSDLIEKFFSLATQWGENIFSKSLLIAFYDLRRISTSINDSAFEYYPYIKGFNREIFMTKK